MPHVRLTGLLLFITSILLGLASAATRTSHVRIKSPTPVSQTEEAALEEPSQVDVEGSNPTTPQPLQFLTLPIFYPLAVVGILGLLLWFVPAAIIPEPGYQQSRGRRGRSKSRSSRSFLFRRRQRR